MLFGRRKPGFTEEEPVISEELEVAASDSSDAKPELMSYLDSLPEVEDNFPEIEEEEEEIELTEAQKFANYIRTRTASATLTSFASLKEEIENIDELLVALTEDESCNDIVFVQGNKDRYYYSNFSMSDNYAMIASLVDEKDLTQTIASMVRFNCKTYPAPTPLNYFEKHPYFSTLPQIERALSLMVGKEEYADIKEFANNKGIRHLYSIEILTERYAKSLAHVDEFVD